MDNDVGSWLGRGITATGVLLAFVMFFMPWVLVSCGGNELGTLSGYRLAVGFEVEGRSFGGTSLLFLTWAFLLASLLVVFVVPSGKIRGVLGVVFGILSTIVVMIVYSHLKQEVKQLGEILQVHIRGGLIGTMLGYLLMIVGGVVDFISGEERLAERGLSPFENNLLDDPYGNFGYMPYAGTSDNLTTDRYEDDFYD